MEGILMMWYSCPGHSPTMSWGVQHLLQSGLGRRLLESARLECMVGTGFSLSGNGNRGLFDTQCLDRVTSPANKQITFFNYKQTNMVRILCTISIVYLNYCIIFYGLAFSVIPNNPLLVPSESHTHIFQHLGRPHGWPSRRPSRSPSRRQQDWLGVAKHHGWSAELLW